tara:strand:- start:444 stop:1088 length:645 start_codon:yes stop_codon:yes gene_type:complete
MAYSSSSSRVIRREESHSDLGKHLRIANPLNDNNHPILVGDEICPLEISNNSVQYRKAPSHSDDIVNKKYVDDSLAFRQIVHSGWNNTGTSTLYMPLNGYVIEKTSTTALNEYVAIVAPYDGQLERVIMRSESACGSSAVGLHISSTGTEVPNSSASFIEVIDMSVDDTPYSFDFSNATFTAGQILAVSFTPTSAGNDTNATLVWRYNSPMAGV